MAPQAARSRLRRISAAMTPQEWTRFGAMLAFILAINALGWGIYVLYVMPHHFVYKGEGSSSGLGVGIGVAITAWLLGALQHVVARSLRDRTPPRTGAVADGVQANGLGAQL